MRLRDLRDVYINQDIYIVGSGPTSNLFPMGFLQDKICMGLNDAYKIHPAVGPIAFMHHQFYARAGNDLNAPYHPHFENIKYPIVKATGRNKEEMVDWDSPYFYFFDWSHDIESIWTQTKETDTLYYTPEGCSLHAALQVAWLVGARNVFLVGCDSRTMGGKHYAKFDKNGFRDDEVLKRGMERNYDSYVYGTLIVEHFLKLKGMRIMNISPIIGYHMVDYQFDFLSGTHTVDDVINQVKAIGGGNG